MLNIASLLLGLCAWLFAMLAITTKRKFLAHRNCLNSFSLCAISLVLQLFEVQRLIRLVEDILRLSRLDEDFGNVRRESVDLFALASEAVSRIQPQAELASVTLELTGQTTLISGFPAQLSAIVTNLCSNAVKYNRPGGRVTVSVQEADTQVVLTVADTGIGIPPEHQPRIFERFYRVDKSHSKAVGGTGLGLSIVKHAALIHNAEISLNSVPEQGTTVTIRFPKE